MSPCYYFCTKFEDISISPHVETAVFVMEIGEGGEESAFQADKHSHRLLSLENSGQTRKKVRLAPP